MHVTVYFPGRPAGAIELRPGDGIAQAENAFEHALRDGERGRITNHPHPSLRSPNPENQLGLAPDTRYFLSVRARGIADASPRLTLRVLQYSAEALVAKARAAAEHGVARLALRTDPALCGTSVVLEVEGTGSVRVDAIRVYPLDAPPREIEEWVEAAAADDDVLDLVRLIRARRPQRSEATRYHFSRIAARLRERIAALRQASANPASLDVAAARLAMLEGDMRAARDLWLRVLDGEPALRDKVIWSLADCELRLGDVETGYRRLLELSKASPDNERLRRHLARAQARIRRVRHQRRAAKILARPGRKTDASIRKLYAGSGLEREQIVRVARLWAEFEQTAALLLGERSARSGPRRSAPDDATGRDALGHPADDLEGVRAVTTTGFGWSGSGAVNDWLREFEVVEMPLGKSESAVIGNNVEIPGAASLLRAQVSVPRQLARTALALVRDPRSLGDELRQLAQALSPRRAHRELHRALEAVLLHTVLAIDERGLLWHAYPDPQTFDAFSEAFDRFITELRALGPNEPELPGRLVGALSRLLLRTAAAKADDRARLLLFNNLVRGVDFPLLRWIPHIRSLAVLRDPRDQYAAWHTEGRAVPAVHEFIAYVRRVRREYAAAMREPAIAGRVLEVQFERFVTSDAYRARIADALQLAGSTVHRGTCFQPAASAANVGIHKQFPDQPAIRAIEKACAPWLFDPASS